LVALTNTKPVNANLINIYIHGINMLNYVTFLDHIVAGRSRMGISIPIVRTIGHSVGRNVVVVGGGGGGGSSRAISVHRPNYRFFPLGRNILLLLNNNNNNNNSNSKRTMSIFHTEDSTLQNSVVLCNGTIVESKEPEDAVLFLKNRPRGPYTTMRTLSNRSRIFQFENHIQRLIDSSRIMMKEEDETNGLFNKMHTMEDVQRSGPSYPLRSLFDRNDLSHIMSKVLLNSIRSFERIYHPPANKELRITVLLVWDRNSNTFDVFTHVETLLDRPDHPILVDIRRGSRRDMKAKDSIWIEQRDNILAKKKKESNEVLMCEENGDVREGLSSNFFIIKDNFVVQTANEGILDGTVKQLIDKIALEDHVHVVCNNIEMKLEYKIPSLRSLSEWKEAFITSTSRQVLPIYAFVIADDCVQFVDEIAKKKLKALKDGDYYYQLLPKGPQDISPYAQALQNVVKEKLIEMSTKIVE
jgi:branched-subunit amino acid aminotransferase/4-amino-4-deoxychorismate lyase